MSDEHKVFIVGKIAGRDGPVRRDFQGHDGEMVPCTNFRVRLQKIASDEKADLPELDELVGCSAFGFEAEYVLDLRKGDAVGVAGTGEWREWENRTFYNVKARCAVLLKPANPRQSPPLRQRRPSQKPAQQRDNTREAGDAQETTMQRRARQNREAAERRASERRGAAYDDAQDRQAQDDAAGVPRHERSYRGR